MINTIISSFNKFVQDGNQTQKKQTKCSGCGNKGHNIRNCDNQSTLFIKSYYEYWINDGLNRKFREIDKINFANNIWKNILDPDIIDLESMQLLMNLNVKTLRIINAKNGGSGKTKKQLINLFIYHQMKKFLQLIQLQEIEFTIERVDTLFIIDCYINYYFDLCNNESIHQSLGNFEYVMDLYFGKRYKIILKYLDDFTPEKEYEEFDCPICLENYKVLETGMITNCNHKFCGKCIKELFSQDCDFNKKKCCALCRNDITSFTVYNKKFIETFCQICTIQKI